MRPRSGDPLCDEPTFATEWAERLGHALRRSALATDGEFNVRAVAEAAGIAHPTLYAILRGDPETYRQILRLDALFRLAGWELTVKLLPLDSSPASDGHDLP